MAESKSRSPELSPLSIDATKPTVTRGPGRAELLLPVEAFISASRQPLGRPLVRPVWVQQRAVEQLQAWALALAQPSLRSWAPRLDEQQAWALRLGEQQAWLQPSVRRVPLDALLSWLRPSVRPFPRAWSQPSPLPVRRAFPQPAAWRQTESSGARHWPWHTRPCLPLP